MGAETHLQPAMLACVRGGVPASDRWAKELSPKALEQGSIGSDGSDNLILMAGAVWLWLEVRDLKQHIPAHLRKHSAVDWCTREVASHLSGGQWMLGELGGRNHYGNWQSLAIGMIKEAVTRTGGSLPLYSHCSDWLEIWQLVNALGVAVGIRPLRNGSGQSDDICPTLTGARSAVRRNPAKEPAMEGVWDRSPEGAYLRMIEWGGIAVGAPRWLGEWDREMFLLCSSHGLTKPVVRVIGSVMAGNSQDAMAAARLIKTGGRQPLHILAWADGTRATVLQSAIGLNAGSTAPAYACVARPGERLRVLYGDSGLRGGKKDEGKPPEQRTIVPVDCTLAVDHGTGFAYATIWRPGSQSIEVAPLDREDFTVDGDQRTMVLHPGGSSLLWHIMIGANGARVFYPSQSSPPVTPPTPEPPTPPAPPVVESDRAKAYRLVRSEVAEMQQQAGGNGYQACSITLIALNGIESGEGLDMEQIRRHAKAVR